MDFQVVLASPYWSLNGVNIFSANLARSLAARGVRAHVLLTEENSKLVTPPEPMMPLPDDIRINRLPVRGEETWGGHWGSMIRYLEQRAPCVYIPNWDLRHSVVCAQLSPGVKVVGVAHSDDPLHYDSDGDGIADYWEYTYFGDLLATDGSIAQWWCWGAFECCPTAHSCCALLGRSGCPEGC